MRSLAEIKERFDAVGLGKEEKYRFIFGPAGLPITAADKNELEELGFYLRCFIEEVDQWYGVANSAAGGSRLVSILNTAIAAEYRQLPWRSELPVTFMVDTIWTHDGWRAVEIDAMNRNAMGYPMIMRHLYGLSCPWSGIDTEWRDKGWSGLTQVMASHHRYYDPYYRFLLSSLGGRLVTEEELPRWLRENQDGLKLLDLPILFRSKESLPELCNLASRVPVGIPPKHYLSSKGVMTLLFESGEGYIPDHPAKRFIPESRFVRRGGVMPKGDFYLKLVQSSGAHGVFHNDREQLALYAEQKKPQAIWQPALPIATRRVQYLDENGELRSGDFYVRISIFVNADGEIVDADATCSPTSVIHGAKTSVMTVPVLS